MSNGHANFSNRTNRQFLIIKYQLNAELRTSTTFIVYFNSISPRYNNYFAS